MAMSNAEVALSAAFPHHDFTKYPSIGDFACTLKGRPGKLYVTQSAVFFIAGLIGIGENVEIKMSDVVFVEKSTMSSVELILKDEKSVYFTALFRRDGAFNLIHSVLFPNESESAYEPQIGSATTKTSATSATVSSGGGRHSGAMTTSSLAKVDSFKTTRIQAGSSGTVSAERLGETMSSAWTSASSVFGGIWAKAKNTIDSNVNVSHSSQSGPSSSGTVASSTSKLKTKNSNVPVSDYDDEYNAHTVMVVAGETTSRNHTALFMTYRQKSIEYQEICRGRVANALRRIALTVSAGDDPTPSSSTSVTRVGSVSFQNPALARECAQCGNKHCPLCGRIYCNSCVKRRVPLPSNAVRSVTMATAAAISGQSMGYGYSSRSGDAGPQSQSESEYLKGVCDNCADLLESGEKQVIWAQIRAAAAQSVPYVTLVSKSGRIRSSIMQLLPEFVEQTRFASASSTTSNDSETQSLIEMKNALQALFTQLEALIRAVNQMIGAANADTVEGSEYVFHRSDLIVLRGLRMVLLAFIEESMPVYRAANRK